MMRSLEAAAKPAAVAEKRSAIAEEAKSGTAKCLEEAKERVTMHEAEAAGTQCEEAAAAALAEAQLSLTEQQQHDVNMAVVEDGMAQLRLSLLDPQQRCPYVHTVCIRYGS